MTRSWTLPVAALAPLLALGACAAYDPPVRADRAAPAYQADLAACREETATAVDLQNAKTVFAWVSSPVRRPGQVRAGVRACLAGRGYTLDG